MNEALFLSIIIPVYNVKEYLRECLDSVVLQETYVKVEIILVDDGSTDGSSEICDEYAEKYERVFVIHKKNSGAPDARNAGIRRALGEYLLFIDADDFISPGSIDRIAADTEAGGKCDVVFLNAYSVHKGGRVSKWSYTYDKSRVYKKSRQEVLSYLASTSRFPVSPCIKLLRRDFVIENNIFFTNGIICEDVDHMIQVLLFAETFNCYDFPYYFARAHREGSVMTASAGANKRFRSTLFIIRKWIDYAENMPEQKNVILGILSVQYIYLVAMYHDIPRDSKKNYVNDIASLSWLLRYGKNKIFLPIRIIYGLLGLRAAAVVLSWLLL